MSSALDHSQQVLTLAVDDAQATEQLGARLAEAGAPGAIIHLSGALGAGKTTLVRGLLRQLGYRGAVKSPTYTLVEHYRAGVYSIYHFDLYRLTEAEELEYLGVRDYFAAGHLCLIEWPERAADLLAAPDLHIAISYAGAGRRIALQAISPLGRHMLSVLKDAGSLSKGSSHLR